MSSSIEDISVLCHFLVMAFPPAALNTCGLIITSEMIQPRLPQPCILVAARLLVWKELEWNSSGETGGNFLSACFSFSPHTYTKVCFLCAERKPPELQLTCLLRVTDRQPVESDEKEGDSGWLCVLAASVPWWLVDWIKSCGVCMCVCVCVCRDYSEWLSVCLRAWGSKHLQATEERWSSFPCWFSVEQTSSFA